MKFLWEKVKDFVLSSTGEGLSQRFQSLCAGLFPLLLVVGPVFGLDITSEALEGFKGVVLEIIAIGIAVGAVIQHIRGWVRANFNKASNLGRFAGR